MILSRIPANIMPFADTLKMCCEMTFIDILIELSPVQSLDCSHGSHNFALSINEEEAWGTTQFRSCTLFVLPQTQGLSDLKYHKCFMFFL